MKIIVESKNMVKFQAIGNVLEKIYTELGDLFNMGRIKRI